MRGLSNEFIATLNSSKGIGLKRVLDRVNSDSTLALEIRENYINIYYRGGNLLKIGEKDGVYSAFF